ncbi:Scramblase-domain-containing protein [Phycomyces blakesleeanus]
MYGRVMQATRLGFTSKSFSNQNVTTLLRFQNKNLGHFYSSLRNPRALGPRGRILNRVTPPRPIRPVLTKEDNISEPSTKTNSVESNVEIQSNEHFAADPANVPVHIPSQPGEVLQPHSPGAAVLTKSALVVGRELEMMNVFLGYEQANKYKIMDPEGNHVGYIAEEEGFGKSLSRQFLKTHRRMNATILDAQGQVVFKIVRPISLINSRIFIYTADDELIGEVQQRWNLVRRKYDLFTGTNQFATIDTPFLGWDFTLQDQNGGTLGNVSRNFVGFAREIFTDSGQYVLRMDAMEDSSRGMTLDERAVTLACAISIDFDYFSRHSSHGSGGFLPFPIFGMGGGEHREAEQEHQPGVDIGPAGAAGIGSGAAGIGSGAAGMGSDVSGSQQQDNSPFSDPYSQQGSEGTTNEYGDVWLSDKEAGVDSPEDGASGILDSLSDFFGSD